MKQESLDPSSDTKGDDKELFNIGIFSGAEGSYVFAQPLPPLLLESTESLAKFYKKCYEFGQLLLQSFAICLDLPKDFFSSKHTLNSHNPSILRLLHYPPSQSATAGPASRAGAHSDYGSLTLLFQRPSGSTGLQILPYGAKTWTPVDIPHQGVLVNVADVMEFWTGGRFRSTLHRVEKPQDGGERWSIAFFDQPDDEAVVEKCVEGEMEPDYVAHLERKGVKIGEKITSGDYLQRRLKATYGGTREGEY